MVFCVDCQHGSEPRARGKWIRVVWPKDPEAIEDVLLERADVRNRNWNPGETLADLRRENTVAAGIAGALAARHDVTAEAAEGLEVPGHLAAAVAKPAARRRRPRKDLPDGAKRQLRERAR